MKQEMNSLYRAEDILDSSPTALVGMNEEEEIIIFNRKAELLFGYSSEEIIGLPLKTLVPERYSKTHKQLVNGYIDQPSYKIMGSREKEMYGRHKNGQEFPVEINLGYSENSNGKIVLAQIVNITEQRQFEKKLTESKRQFKNLFDQSPNAIIIHNFEKITHVNNTFLKIYGYENDKSIIGKSPFETIIHTDDLAIIEKAIEQLAIGSEGKPVHIPQVKILKADGTFLVAEAYVSITLVNEIRHIQIVSRDITERRKLEQRLLKSEEKFKGLFNSMIDLFVRVTNEGIVDVVSPSVYEVLGYKAMCLTGKKAIDFYENSEDRDMLIQTVMNTGYCRNFEAPIITKDGGRKILSINAKIYYDEEGNPLGIESISRDITSYKKQELTLVNNERVLRSFFDLAPIGIALKKLSGEFVEVNSEFTRFTGYSKEELNELSYWELTPEKYSGQEEIMLNLLNTESAYGPYEKEYIHKDGSVFPVLLNGIKIQDSNGEELIWSTIQDITDINFQKKTLQNLATGLSAIRGEEFFNKVSGYLANSLNFDYAFIGKIAEGDDMISVIGGVHNGEEIPAFDYFLEGTPCANVIGHQVCSYNSGVQELFPNDQLLIDMNIEGYIGCPLMDGNGNSVGIIVLLSECPVTNDEIAETTLQVFSERVSSEILRLENEEKLAESENRLASINKNSPDLITTVDRDLKVSYINRVGQSYQMSDVIGSDVMLYVPDEFKEQYLKYVTYAFNGKNQHFEMEGYGTNLESAWYSVRISPMEKNKSITSLLIISTDITSQKKLEIRNEVVNSISNQLSANVSLNEFCSFIFSELQKIKSFPDVYISSYDEAKNKITVFFEAEEGQVKQELSEPRIAGNGLSEYIIKTKKGLLLNGQEAFQFQKKHRLKIYGEMAKSWIGVPLMNESKPVGVLAVQCFDEGNVYTKSDLELLSFIGTQIASFVEKSIAEKEIRQFEKYFSVSMDLLCIAGTDGFFKKINPKFSEFLGYSKEELLSKSFIDFIHPDDVEATYKEIEQLSQGDITINFMNRYLCSNGQHKNLLWSAVSDPESGAIFAAARDITGQIKSQEILTALTDIQDAFIDNKSSKESFDKMLSILLEVTQSEFGFIAEVLHDKDEQPYLRTQAITNIYWNKESSDYYKDNSIAGLEFRNLETLFGRAITTGKPVISSDPGSDPRRGGLPPGHPAMDDFMGIPFFYNNELIGMIGVANKPCGYNNEDVRLLAPFLATCSTLLKAHQNNIKKQEVEREVRKLADIVSHSVDAIISTDKNDIVTSWNKGAEKLLGYSYEEILGKSMDVLWPKPIAHEHSRIIGSIINGNSKENYETLKRKKDGTLIDVNLSIFPLIDQKGKVKGVSRIMRDTSVQKEAQKIKEEFTRSLEIKVKERTKDLEDAQKQLTLSLAKEKELNDLKSQFVSTASHQFRTPLAVIKASIAILDMQKDQMVDKIRPVFEKTYTRIGAQIDRMTNLMDDVLIVGKINEGIVEPKLIPTDIVELCKEISKNHNEIQSDNRRIVFTVKGKPVEVDLDKKLMGHALSNLISNALKYSPGAKAPSLTIVFSKRDVQISVKDHGIGIPEQDLKSLFEPFYRASNIGDIPGTGLGTSIAKEYVKLNNGTISLKSELDKGSEFIITFSKS